MTDERAHTAGADATPQGEEQRRSEPEWLAPYIGRKTAAFMALLDAGVDEEWCGPGRDLREAAQTLVREVIGEMALLLSAPHEGPGEEPVREARELWAAGS